MADLAKQSITLLGVAPAYVAAAGGGDKIVGPSERVFLHVKNGGGSPQTVTVATPRTDPETGLAEADVAVSVPAGGERMIGPFRASTFGDPADAGKAAVTYSGVTSVTVGCFEVEA
jgi:hypothetical protein